MVQELIVDDEIRGKTLVPNQVSIDLILHSKKCTSGQIKRPCTMAYCKTMKKLLDHMLNCKDYTICTYNRCTLSFELLGHYKLCSTTEPRPFCLICKPFRSKLDVPLEVTDEITGANLTLERRTQFQQHLALLLHANQCNRKQSKKPQFKKCSISDCKIMKKVLGHLSNCIRRHCSFPHCKVTRKMIGHYKTCKLAKYDCFMCSYSMKEPTGSRIVVVRSSPL